ncbi:hypothetical protein ACQPXH_23920 [Nocardia sp. CA-135953]|uniref:hypothetical protein n=1 Tax=Nocardia sp. CA-135953 TaxID=3239978 RepID=UPI003D95A11D
MSKNGRTNYRRGARGRAKKAEYRVVVEGVRKEPYDISRLAKAALGLARAKADKTDAQAEIAEAATIAGLPANAVDRGQGIADQEDGHDAR